MLPYTYISAHLKSHKNLRTNASVKLTSFQDPLHKGDSDTYSANEGQFTRKASGVSKCS